MRSARWIECKRLGPFEFEQRHAAERLIDFARLHPQDEIAVLDPRAARAGETDVRQLAGGFLALGELRQRRRDIFADAVHDQGRA